MASEIKALLAHPEVKTTPDEVAHHQWMAFNNVFDGRTMFEGIKVVPKATISRLCKESIETKKLFSSTYWRWDFSKTSYIPYEDAQEKLWHLLTTAVAKMIPKEVTYGTLLSGGIDSNVIAVLAASYSESGIPAFTVGYEGNDERMLAEKSLSEKLTHYSVFYKDVCHMKKTIFHLEDLRVGASWSNYGMFQMASKFVKVLFDGTGSDELFMGYPWRYNMETPYYDIVNRTKVKHWFPETFFKEVYKEDSFESRLKFDADFFLEAVLMVGDKLSMAHTLEVRYPFLDNDLVDFILTLPYEYRENKKILRETFASMLHPDVLNAPKQGFSSQIGRAHV